LPCERCGSVWGTGPALLVWRLRGRPRSCAVLCMELASHACIVVIVYEMRMHSGMSLFSGRQPLDTAVMAQKAEALRCDALWKGEHASLPVQRFPPALGSSGGSIPAVKVFHRCGSRSSLAISHAAQARKSMLAVTASEPTN